MSLFGDDELLQFIVRQNAFIIRQLERLGRRMTEVEDKLNLVLADVTGERTQIASLSTLIAGLRKSVADALAAGNVPQSTVDLVNEVFAAAETNKADIVTALNAGTPAINTDVTGAGPNPALGPNPTSGATQTQPLATADQSMAQPRQTT